METYAGTADGAGIWALESPSPDFGISPLLKDVLGPACQFLVASGPAAQAQGHGEKLAVICATNPDEVQTHALVEWLITGSLEAALHAPGAEAVVSRVVGVSTSTQKATANSGSSSSRVVTLQLCAGNRVLVLHAPDASALLGWPAVSRLLANEQAIEPGLPFGEPRFVFAGKDLASAAIALVAQSASSGGAQLRIHAALDLSPLYSPSNSNISGSLKQRSRSLRSTISAMMKGVDISASPASPSDLSEWADELTSVDWASSVLTLPQILALALSAWAACRVGYNAMSHVLPRAIVPGAHLQPPHLGVGPSPAQLADATFTLRGLDASVIAALHRCFVVASAAAAAAASSMSSEPEDNVDAVYAAVAPFARGVVRSHSLMVASTHGYPPQPLPLLPAPASQHAPLGARLALCLLTGAGFRNILPAVLSPDAAGSALATLALSQQLTSELEAASHVLSGARHLPLLLEAASDVEDATNGFKRGLPPALVSLLAQAEAGLGLDQRLALLTSHAHRVTVVNGGPGTGKTRVAAILARTLAGRPDVQRCVILTPNHASAAAMLAALVSGGYNGAAMVTAQPWSPSPSSPSDAAIAPFVLSPDAASSAAPVVDPTTGAVLAASGGAVKPRDGCVWGRLHPQQLAQMAPGMPMPNVPVPAIVVCSAGDFATLSSGMEAAQPEASWKLGVVTATADISGLTSSSSLTSPWAGFVRGAIQFETAGALVIDDCSSLPEAALLQLCASAALQGVSRLVAVGDSHCGVRPPAMMPSSAASVASPSYKSLLDALMSHPDVPVVQLRTSYRLSGPLASIISAAISGEDASSDSAADDKGQLNINKSEDDAEEAAIAALLGDATLEATSKASGSGSGGSSTGGKLMSLPNRDTSADAAFASALRSGLLALERTAQGAKYEREISLLQRLLESATSASNAAAASSSSPEDGIPSSSDASKLAPISAVSLYDAFWRYVDETGDNPARRAELESAILASGVVDTATAEDMTSVGVEAERRIRGAGSIGGAGTRDFTASWQGLTHAQLAQAIALYEPAQFPALLAAYTRRTKQQQQVKSPSTSSGEAGGFTTGPAAITRPVVWLDLPSAAFTGSASAQTAARLALAARLAFALGSADGAALQAQPRVIVAAPSSSSAAAVNAIASSEAASLTMGPMPVAQIASTLTSVPVAQASGGMAGSDVELVIVLAGPVTSASTSTAAAAYAIGKARQAAVIVAPHAAVVASAPASTASSADDETPSVSVEALLPAIAKRCEASGAAFIYSSPNGGGTVPMPKASAQALPDVNGTAADQSSAQQPSGAGNVVSVSDLELSLQQHDDTILIGGGAVSGSPILGPSGSASGMRGRAHSLLLDDVPHPSGTSSEPTSGPVATSNYIPGVHPPRGVHVVLYAALMDILRTAAGSSDVTSGGAGGWVDSATIGHQLGQRDVAHLLATKLQKVMKRLPGLETAEDSETGQHAYRLTPHGMAVAESVAAAVAASSSSVSSAGRSTSLLALLGGESLPTATSSLSSTSPWGSLAAAQQQLQTGATALSAADASLPAAGAGAAAAVVRAVHPAVTSSVLEILTSASSSGVNGGWVPSAQIGSLLSKRNLLGLIATPKLWQTLRRIPGLQWREGSNPAQVAYRLIPGYVPPQPQQQPQQQPAATASSASASGGKPAPLSYAAAAAARPAPGASSSGGVATIPGALTSAAAAAKAGTGPAIFLPVAPGFDQRFVAGVAIVLSRLGRPHNEGWLDLASLADGLHQCGASSFLPHGHKFRTAVDALVALTSGGGVTSEQAFLQAMPVKASCRYRLGPRYIDNPAIAAAASELLPGVVISSNPQKKPAGFSSGASVAGDGSVASGAEGRPSSQRVELPKAVTSGGGGGDPDLRALLTVVADVICTEAAASSSGDGSERGIAGAKLGHALSQRRLLHLLKGQKLKDVLASAVESGALSGLRIVVQPGKDMFYTLAPGFSELVVGGASSSSSAASGPGAPYINGPSSASGITDVTVNGGGSNSAPPPAVLMEALTSVLRRLPPGEWCKSAWLGSKVVDELTSRRIRLHPPPLGGWKLADLVAASPGGSIESHKGWAGHKPMLSYRLNPAVLAAGGGAAAATPAAAAVSAPHTSASASASSTSGGGAAPDASLTSAVEWYIRRQSERGRWTSGHHAALRLRVERGMIVAPEQVEAAAVRLRGVKTSVVKGRTMYMLDLTSASSSSAAAPPAAGAAKPSAQRQQQADEEEDGDEDDEGGEDDEEDDGAWQRWAEANEAEGDEGSYQEVKTRRGRRKEAAASAAAAVADNKPSAASGAAAQPAPLEPYVTSEIEAVIRQRSAEGHWITLHSTAVKVCGRLGQRALPTNTQVRAVAEHMPGVLFAKARQNTLVWVPAIPASASATGAALPGGTGKPPSLPPGSLIRRGGAPTDVTGAGGNGFGPIPPGLLSYSRVGTGTATTGADASSTAASSVPPSAGAGAASSRTGGAVISAAEALGSSSAGGYQGTPLDAATASAAAALIPQVLSSDRSIPIHMLVGQLRQRGGIHVTAAQVKLLLSRIPGVIQGVHYYAGKPTFQLAPGTVVDAAMMAAAAAAAAAIAGGGAAPSAAVGAPAAPVPYKAAAAAGAPAYPAAATAAATAAAAPRPTQGFAGPAPTSVAPSSSTGSVLPPGAREALISALTSAPGGQLQTVQVSDVLEKAGLKARLPSGMKVGSAIDTDPAFERVRVPTSSGGFTAGFRVKPGFLAQHRAAPASAAVAAPAPTAASVSASLSAAVAAAQQGSAAVTSYASAAAAVVTSSPTSVTGSTAAGSSPVPAAPYPSRVRVWIGIIRAVAASGIGGVGEGAVQAALQREGLLDEALALAGTAAAGAADVSGGIHILLNSMGELEVDPTAGLYRLTSAGGPLPPPPILDIIYTTLTSAGWGGMLLSALGQRLKAGAARIGITFSGRSLAGELVRIPGVYSERDQQSGELVIKLACFVW